MHCIQYTKTSITSVEIKKTEQAEKDYQMNYYNTL